MRAVQRETYQRDALMNQHLGEATMSEPGWVSDAYYARFGNFPPVLYWRSTVKGLQALMMQALERGTPLTADELMKVQERAAAGGEDMTPEQRGPTPCSMANVGEDGGH